MEYAPKKIKTGYGLPLGMTPVIKGGTRVETARPSHWTRLGTKDYFAGITYEG